MGKLPAFLICVLHGREKVKGSIISNNPLVFSAAYAGSSLHLGSSQEDSKLFREKREYNMPDTGKEQSGHSRMVVVLLPFLHS